MYSRAACAAQMADGNDHVADLDPDRNGSSDPPKKRPRPQYKTKWQQNWSSKYPCITKKSETLAECSVCFRVFDFDHQGERHPASPASNVLGATAWNPFRARDPLNCVTSDN